MYALAAFRAAREVPFVDLRRQHAAIAEELRMAFDDVLAEGRFILGREVERLETEFAELCGVRHCIGVASGTAALTLALIAAGVEEGDQVIVPAHTYIATALSVLHAGAVPRFCDVDDATGLIDVRSAGEAMSSHTVAVVPVHLYGQVCDMDAIRRFARRQGLLVVEDAAQAHGARWKGARAGSFGDAAAFSFYPSKNLGGLGDGGAICTDNDGIAERCRRLRNQGQRRKGEHIEAGFNERLDELQAAMLRVKLPRLDAANGARRAWAALYREVLPDASRPVLEDRRGECVYHLFPVRVAGRDTVKARLHSLGIQTGIHYWPAAHRQQPFASGRFRQRSDYTAGTELTAAVRWSQEELSLPMFPELTRAEVLAVAEALSGAVGRARE
jgi:Predicted pyridoxal phosphate-dependent enzyme apparently involved in regulation of cell wall biogenesis